MPKRNLSKGSTIKSWYISTHFKFFLSFKSMFFVVERCFRYEILGSEVLWSTDPRLERAWV
jgi:hypothetical protein